MGPAEYIAGLLERQRAAGLVPGGDDAASRRARLQSIIDLLAAHHQPIVEAIDADFGGRHRGYSIMNDILGSLASLKHARDNLEPWMAPESRPVPEPDGQLGATAHVRYQPKGTVGIIGTWNAPVFTLLSPLACVLAAGNRAILKPSEVLPRTARLLADLFAAHVDPTDVAVVTGGPDVADAFTRQPFGHLVFTGSTTTGRQVMRNAAEHLVPVTLELGGKSPVIVGRSADLAMATERVAIAKASNAGQLCVSADLVYVPSESVEDVVAGLAQSYAELLPRAVGNPDTVNVVNDHHRGRIRGYLDDAASRRTRIVTTPDESIDTRAMPLSIAVDPPADAHIMHEEIFGPALVLLPYDTVAEALADINSRPHPLALYYFGTDETEKDTVLESTLSGGVTVNDLLLHAGVQDAPFGGVGASGIGHYHGRDGFLEFSHARTVFEASTADIRRQYGLIPPYRDDFETMMAAQVTR